MPNEIKEHDFGKVNMNWLPSLADRFTGESNKWPTGVPCLVHMPSVGMVLAKYDGQKWTRDNGDILRADGPKEKRETRPSLAGKEKVTLDEFNAAPVVIVEVPTFITPTHFCQVCDPFEWDAIMEGHRRAHLEMIREKQPQRFAGILGEKTHPMHDLAHKVNAEKKVRL